MATTNQNPSSLQTFDKLEADITLFVEPCKSITVTDKESCESALDTAKQIKSFIKKIDERRKELTQPLEAEKKRIIAYADKIAAPLVEVETQIKAKLAAYAKILEAERQEAMKKAEEERKRREEEARAALKAKEEEAAAMAMFMPEKEVKKQAIIQQTEEKRTLLEIQQSHNAEVREISSHKVSGARQRWTFEITDEALVPREYLSIDEKKINAAIKAGTRDLPGVRIFQDTVIAIGGR